MSIVTAKKLNEALIKAKNIGLVEETFILEDCELTLRNLRPKEYVEVLQMCQGLDDVSYLNTYQTEHISRAIVAINGVDLRDTKYVTEEEPDPLNPDKSRSVKVELHSYLIKNVVSTWSKEALYTVYRKFTDVVERAERKAKEGVTFLLQEETNEEKYRRLLLEAKECEENLPDTLINHILEEHGLIRKATAEEIKAVMERTDQIAREAEKEVQKSSVLIPEPSKLVEVVETAPEAAQQPLNQSSSSKPVIDPHLSLQKAIEARKAIPAEPQDENKQSLARAAKIAALEGDAGISGIDLSLPKKENFIPTFRPGEIQEVVEIRKREPVDPKEVSTILDQPPRSGINPRFRPQNKI